jgi:nitrate reductase assembly molybdenum cofactor insertion protein NarJ
VSAVALSCGERQALARAFAGVLSYPYEDPTSLARTCAQVVATAGSEPHALLLAFAAFSEATSLGPLQEAYTRTFDLDTMTRSEPTCYPYVGHYLFDESHKRGAFILELRKRFRAARFEDDSDLSDHLVVLLRFLSVCDDDILAEELISDAILPALSRMAVSAKGDAARSNEGRDAYLGVVRALECVLADGRDDALAGQVEPEIEREWLRDRDSLGIDRDWCGH